MEEERKIVFNSLLYDFFLSDFTERYQLYFDMGDLEKYGKKKFLRMQVLGMVSSLLGDALESSPKKEELSRTIYKAFEEPYGKSSLKLICLVTSKLSCISFPLAVNLLGLVIGNGNHGSISVARKFWKKISEEGYLEYAGEAGPVCPKQGLTAVSVYRLGAKGTKLIQDLIPGKRPKVISAGYLQHSYQTVRATLLLIRAAWFWNERPRFLGLEQRTPVMDIFRTKYDKKNGKESLDIYSDAVVRIGVRDQGNEGEEEGKQRKRNQNRNVTFFLEMDMGTENNSVIWRKIASYTGEIIQDGFQIDDQILLLSCSNYEEETAYVKDHPFPAYLSIRKVTAVLSYLEMHYGFSTALSDEEQRKILAGIPLDIPEEDALPLPRELFSKIVRHLIRQIGVCGGIGRYVVSIREGWNRERLEFLGEAEKYVADKRRASLLQYVLARYFDEKREPDRAVNTSWETIRSGMSIPVIAPNGILWKLRYFCREESFFRDAARDICDAMRRKLLKSEFYAVEPMTEGVKTRFGKLLFRNTIFCWSQTSDRPDRIVSMELLEDLGSQMRCIAFLRAFEEENRTDIRQRCIILATFDPEKAIEFCRDARIPEGVQGKNLFFYDLCGDMEMEWDFDLENLFVCSEEEEDLLYLQRRK